MANHPKTQFRLNQITGSLPVMTGSSLTVAPAFKSTKELIDEMASSIRRIVDFDTTNTSIFESDPTTFKSMGTEGRFVITPNGNNQGLYISGSLLATKITGSSGLELVASNAGAVVIDGSSGVSFSEDGTEVIVIDGNGDTRFTSAAGTIDDPDVEIDGYLRLDSDFASSGSLTFTGTASRHDITKASTGDLVLSGAGGKIYLIDSYAADSNWSDKNLGLPLATSAAQWSTLASLGFSSLIDALTSTGTQDKTIVTLASDLTAGNPTSQFTVDLTNIGASNLDKRVDVFVNGMLQLSGSAAQVTAGEVDYRLTGAINSTDVIFSYDLITDDRITILSR